MLQLTDSIQHPNSLCAITYGLVCPPESPLQGLCCLQPKCYVLKNIFKYLTNFEAGCSNTCCLIVAQNYCTSLISGFCDLAQLLFQVYTFCQIPESDAPHISHRQTMKKVRLEKWLTAATSAAAGHTATFISVHSKQLTLHFKQQTYFFRIGKNALQEYELLCSRGEFLDDLE